MPYLIPRSKSTVLDASGAGQVTFAIDNTNQRWMLDAVYVQTNQAATAIPVPTAAVFVNTTAPSGFRGGTSSGSGDNASGRVILYDGDVLYVVWAAGIPGTTATAIIDGTYDGAGMAIQD